jgi:hypothetical protein
MTDVGARASTGAPKFPLFAAIAFGLAAAAGLAWPKAQAVLEQNAFFDSDDAMRAVQVRDLLAGQSWFDMNNPRVDPPAGLFNHWSRIVDVPLAALELLFRLFASVDQAERWARLAFPAIMLTALLFAGALLARRFDGRASRLAAVAAVFLTGPMFLQFSPGRIDHHAPQIVLLLLAAAFFCEGLAPERARAMAFSAAAMAVSLAISLENAPFFLPLIAALPILFIVDGAPMHRALAWFALGVVVAFPLVGAATIAPARYALSVCDAYSAVHVVAMLLGALGLAALAFAAPRLADWRKRALAVALAGLPPVGAVLALAPRCLGDPLVDLDPLLRQLWLVHVGEMQPILAVAAKSPNVAGGLAIPAALSIAALLLAAKFCGGVQRRRALVLAAALFAGFLVALGQVRVFTSVGPLAAVPLAAILATLVQRAAAAQSFPTQAALIGALCIAVSPMGLTLALPAGAGAGEEALKAACLTPKALAPLASLPAARVVAPIEMGAHILAVSPHSVFAAPYHRDNHGNRLAVDVFAAPPDEAETLLRSAGAELVVWCDHWPARGVVGDAPQNALAFRLAAGAAPDWLEEKNPGGAPLHVFAVRRHL